MKQKVEIMSMTDEILSPITKASNVLLEDGSNVQQLIDNYVEPEFTPTIENSSSMFKVGQGDNVDFSANVINGAYESCVLKGRTLVNYNAEGNDRNEYVCMPSVEGESVTVNGTVEGMVKSAILKGSTKYRDIDTGEVLDAFEDGRNLELVSVKMPVLTTTGKNLFNPNAEFNMTDGLYGFIKLTNNKNNSISVVEKDNTVDMSKIYFGLTSRGIDATGGCHWLHSAGNLDITKIENSHLGYFSFYPNNKTTLNKILQRYDIQFEEGTTATSYEPFKTNILTVNEDVTLRGIGNVKDTLDCLTGEVTERIGEIVLDGSGYITFTNPFNGVYEYALNGNVANMIITIPKTSSTNYTNPSYNGYYYLIGNKIRIIQHDCASADDFKQWLQQNSITVQYELAEPIVKTVDLKGQKVYSYNDTTHYDCSSAEGSLIPTLSIEEGVKYQAIIKPSTKYSIVFNRTVASDSLTVDLGGATANVVSTAVGKTIVQITALPTLSHNYVKFLGVGNAIKDVQVIEGDVVDDIEYFEGMIDVENPVVTNCNMLDVDSVDYKSNTISTNEVVLRSLPNGVCDTLDLMTGEYVQRVGEGVLNGTEDGWVANTTKEKTQVFELDVWNNAVTSMNGKNNNNLYCDKYVADSGIDRELISFYVGHIYIALLKKNASTVEELKTYLQSNPVTVQYELETPITTTIDIKQHPYAYKDGYINLSSNSENSLAPSIEYSLPINRSGQVSINTQLVQKQQKQLDELESMIIANMVNTQYKQTLSSVEHMLGGE